MPRATLTVTIPDGIWIGDVTRAHPDAAVRILSALTGDDSGVGLVEITAPELQALLDDLRENGSVTELTVLERTAETALVQFETTMPLLLLPVEDSGVPLTMPFTIQEGEAEWELTAPQHRISNLGTQLNEFGISFTVDEIRQQIEPEQVLTDRQLRLVRAAVEEGYYDTPRRCSLTDLAETVGLAKSTCSETLHRAEERVMKRFLDEFDETAIGSPNP
ncbi:helix-turn-helix domain-containing protein [Candidatus Halobonum tyrrellensis]|uniref:helix-turn-helix domain-containing protein n=1 Tax=Candidatus Halobonum tyrrellensis TaxID=1431545 RepID=UPI00067809F5|nr:helix-turn-helix domain-containing protein [Candidatus Halobonum tyrrellensis]